MQAAPNGSELVVGQCELTEAGEAWLREYPRFGGVRAPRHAHRTMVELYIMTHGVPFGMLDLLEWLPDVMDTYRQLYLEGPPKSGASGGNLWQSGFKSNIRQQIEQTLTQDGPKCTNPLLVAHKISGRTINNLHPNHVDSIRTRNTEYLRPRTQEGETTSESDEEQETDVIDTTSNNGEVVAENSGTGHQTASYPPATVNVNVEGLSFAPAPPSSSTGSTSSSTNQNTESANNTTPGFVYVLVRVVRHGENLILHHIVKIGEVGSSDESLNVESEMEPGGSLSNREYKYQSSTESVVEDTQGRFIHHQIVAVVPCEDNRGFHERSGVGTAIHDEGFGRIGNIPQQENYRVFNPQEIGEDESGIEARRNALTNLLSVVRTYAEENDECHEMFVFQDRLQQLGIDMDSI